MEKKELGPNVLRNSKYNALLTPFELEWTFGFDVTIPVISLCHKDRKEIFYVAANVGILYNYCTKTMVHLKGHQSKIISASVDKTGQWLITADNGAENLMLIWNTKSHDIVWSIFNHVLGYNVNLVALSNQGWLLVTISNKNENFIDFWLWTEGNDKPNDTYTSEISRGMPKSIEFHPNKEEHLMIVFEKSVLFFEWDSVKQQVSQPVEPKAPCNGFYTDGTYVESNHECYVSTSKGSILVYGTSIYSKMFSLEELNNKKKFVKSIKVTKTAINCITSINQILVTGDSRGSILFFDKKLKLLFWLSNKTIGPIKYISFQEKYDYTTTNKPTKNISKIIEHQEIVKTTNCFDYSDLYEEQIGQKLPNNSIFQNCAFVLQDFFIISNHGTINLVNCTDCQIIPLFPKTDSNVASIDVHDELPYIIVAYTKGNVAIFNYITHEEVISTTIPSSHGKETLSTIKYSPQCLHLACGKSNGELWFLQPAILESIFVKPLQFGKNKIVKIVFSKDSLQMAYYDNNMTVYGFYYNRETEDWIFKGKARTHYKEISNILFFENEPTELWTIGHDRIINKYTNLTPSAEILDTVIRERIDQQNIPLYFISYPKGKFSQAGYFLVADDKHKLKIINAKTLMTTAVYLGPAYGCFKHNPICKMEFLNKSNHKFLIFMTKNQIGIHLLPLDGNPYKFVGCLGHPDELLDFQISYDSKYLFIAGNNDRTVFKWRINTQSVETMYQFSGCELQPFYCLLEGGRDGHLFQEMKDLFYYLQILQQGEQVCASRTVKNYISINEIPELLRACGFYPTEFEIENILIDLKYKVFDETGYFKDKVTFCDFVQIFINHKPPYGYPIKELQKALELLSCYSEDGMSAEIERETFVEALSSGVEGIRTDQLYKYLTTLMRIENSDIKIGEHKEFDFLPEILDCDIFVENILGFDTGSIECKEIEAKEDNDKYPYGYFC